MNEISLQGVLEETDPISGAVTVEAAHKAVSLQPEKSLSAAGASPPNDGGGEVTMVYEGDDIGNPSEVRDSNKISKKEALGADVIKTDSGTLEEINERNRSIEEAKVSLGHGTERIEEDPVVVTTDGNAVGETGELWRDSSQESSDTVNTWEVSNATEATPIMATGVAEDIPAGAPAPEATQATQPETIEVSVESQEPNIAELALSPNMTEGVAPSESGASESDPERTIAEISASGSAESNSSTEVEATEATQPEVEETSGEAQELTVEQLGQAKESSDIDFKEMGKKADLISKELSDDIDKTQKEYENLQNRIAAEREERLKRAEKILEDASQNILRAQSERDETELVLIEEEKEIARKRAEAELELIEREKEIAIERAEIDRKFNETVQRINPILERAHEIIAEYSRPKS